MIIRLFSCLLLAVFACCFLSLRSVTRADVLLPPGHAVFTGLTGGSYSAFEHQLGQQPQRLLPRWTVAVER